MAGVKEGKSWETFTEFVDDLKNHCSHFVWRGVSRYEYNILPKVGRQVSAPTTSEEIKDFYSKEETLFELFRSRAGLVYSGKSMNLFEQLALAQHYGVPTRLLDWTENPLVALYFASAFMTEDEEFDGALIGYHQSSFVSSYDLDPFDNAYTGFVLAPYVTQRLAAQCAVFSIQSKPWEEFETDTEHEIMKCRIPSNLKKELLLYLPRLGVNRRTLFADLDSYASDVEKIYDAMECKEGEKWGLVKKN